MSQSLRILLRITWGANMEWPARAVPAFDPKRGHQQVGFVAVHRNPTLRLASAAKVSGVQPMSAFGGENANKRLLELADILFRSKKGSHWKCTCVQDWLSNLAF
jgi:hypothetical protein